MDGGYEVVRRDTTRREHDVATETSIGRITRDLTIWMAARDFPGRPTQHTSNFSNTAEPARPVRGEGRNAGEWACW
ncbi:hypothetical protein [Streptomyces sp. NPDC058653]|uniref:hypothetical protein n=1 Tax=Streptomyces sp. NPDC058653 TaxID=3346576 RepID=UPI00364E6BC5